MGRKKIAIQKIQDSRLRIVTLNKRKKGLIKKAMEISLLTGVHLILTIFDKEEGKIIQYLSDSVEKFRVINQMQEIAVRKRYVKDPTNSNAQLDLQHDAEDNQPSASHEHEDLPCTQSKKPVTPIQYINQKIQSEIYTNDHYDYLFNNGPLPDNMVIDSLTASVQDENEVIKDNDESMMDSLGGGPSQKKRGRQSKRDRKKKEKTNQNYRLKPPPKILNQQRNAEMANEKEAPESIVDSIKVGQDNLRQQLDFIQDVSNPQVRDQDPIDPDAPVEKEFARIQQIRKQQKLKLKLNQKGHQQENQRLSKSKQKQNDEDNDETSDEDIEELQNEYKDLDKQTKFDNQSEQLNLNHFNTAIQTNQNQLQYGQFSKNINHGHFQNSPCYDQKLDSKHVSKSEIQNQSINQIAEMKDDFLNIPSNDNHKMKLASQSNGMNEITNQLDIQSQNQQQANQIDKMINQQDINSANYQFDLNLGSDHSSKIKNISQALTNEDILKMIKQKNKEKRQERENNQSQIEKDKYQVPTQQSKQLLSLQKQEISFNDRFAKYMSPQKKNKPFGAGLLANQGLGHEEQLTGKDAMSSKSNNFNQNNLMDKFLLEDQEDISKEQKDLTKFYKKLKKQEELPYNDILLKIQNIRSGGNPHKEKQNKQVGIDQFEKNLLQKVEEDRQKERDQKLKFYETFKQNKLNSSNSHSNSRSSSNSDSNLSSQEQSCSSNSKNVKKSNEKKQKNRNHNKQMPQIKLSFDQNHQKIPLAEEGQITKKDKNKPIESKKLGRKRDRRHSKEDKHNLEKQIQKKQRYEEEASQQQSDFHRQLKEGQKLYQMQILNQLQNNHVIGNTTIGSPFAPFNNGMFQRENSKTASKESDSQDLISSPCPKSQMNQNNYLNHNSSKKHGGSSINHPLINNSGQHAHKYGPINPMLMTQFNPYLYYPQQYLGLQAQFSGVQGYPFINPHLLGGPAPNMAMYPGTFQNYQVVDSYGIQSNNSQTGLQFNQKGKNVIDAFGNISRSVSKTNKSQSKLFQTHSQRANSKNHVLSDAKKEQQLNELRKLIFQQGNVKGSNSTHKLKSPRTQSMISLSKKDESFSQTSIVENSISPKTNISSLKKQLQKHGNIYPGSGHQAFQNGLLIDAKAIYYKNKVNNSNIKRGNASESLSDNTTQQNEQKEKQNHTEISTSKFPSQNRSNSPENIRRGLGKQLGLQFQGLSNKLSDKTEIDNLKQKGIANMIMSQANNQIDQQKSHHSRRRSDIQTADKVVTQDAQLLERFRNMDQENIRKFRFLEQMNNDNNTIVNTSNGLITGKNMMLSGQGFEFSMREAKILGRKNLQNFSDQSLNGGYGSTFNHLSTNKRNNREQYQIDEISSQSGLNNPQSK